MRERIGEVIVHLGMNAKPLKSGKHGLYVRVQHRNENRYYTAHAEMDPGEWERFERCPEADHPATLCFRKFTDAVGRLVRAGDFSFTALSLLCGRSRCATVQELTREKAEEARKRGGGGHTTAEMYDELAALLDMYLGGPVPVNRLTRAKCEGFLEWLSGERGNGPTTVGIRARQLNAVLNSAFKGHMAASNPLEGVKRPAGRRRNLTVATESLHRLLTATPGEAGDGYGWLCHWRAIYYGNGMNVKDLLRLRRTDLDAAADELVFVRRKTERSSGATVRVPLTPELEDALSAIATGREHYLPYLDGVAEDSAEAHRIAKKVTMRINKHMRKVCEALGISERVTTYTARHCFATVLLRNGVPVEFISEALGHSNIQTTRNYLDGYTEEQRRERAKLLKV